MTFSLLYLVLVSTSLTANEIAEKMDQVERGEDAQGQLVMTLKAEGGRPREREIQFHRVRRLSGNSLVFFFTEIGIQSSIWTRL